MIDMQSVKFVSVTPPEAIRDNSSWATAEIDTKGFDYATILVYLGATDIAMAALKLQESDTSGSGFADVSGADFSVSPATLPSATDDNKLFAIFVDLTKRKRYLDLVMTAGDGATGTFAVALAILSRAEEAPNSASERGLSQQLIV
ncbi:MAG TPA: hypothetical protein VNO70_17905 [Blastocatellia bacterium]|nr:hypothetical protein [Blastocatellia bacterium]